MARKNDLDEFYEILKALDHTYGERCLTDCDGHMGWPKQGVYFFFEAGEIRESTGTPRVVRVGTHVITEHSQTTLRDRLRAHKGPTRGEYAPGGNHRGSVFRLHIGTALIMRDRMACSTWGKQSSADRQTRIAEKPLEISVSEVIRTMPFLWIRAEDTPSTDSVRSVIERNSIALLSNYRKTAIDPSSQRWLGRYCSNEKVQLSGLWNDRHVEEQYDPTFLRLFARLAAGT